MAHFVQVWVAGELHHGWGSAHQDQGVLTGAGQVVSDHVLTDEAFTVVPVWNTRGYNCHNSVLNHTRGYNRYNSTHYQRLVQVYLCIYYKQLHLCNCLIQAVKTVTPLYVIQAV